MGILFSAISRTRLQAAQMFLFFFITMLIITMMIREPVILPFLPLEQAEVAFTNLASRGMSLLEIGDTVFYLVMNAGIYLLLTILYLKRKKEFV
ncbi:MAG: hypothetical protein GY870_19925, partial [archaeon]|nr:hypothetical protein [archaeon]